MLREKEKRRWRERERGKRIEECKERGWGMFKRRMG